MTKAIRAFAMLAFVIGSFAVNMSALSAYLPLPTKGW